MYDLIKNVYCPKCNREIIWNDNRYREIITCEECNFTNIMLAFSLKPLKEGANNENR